MLLILKGSATWRKVLLRSIRGKKLPNDHRHRRWSPRAQQLLTACQRPSPSLPAACSRSDTPAISGHDFWHNKPQRPEQELLDTSGAQVQLVQVINLAKAKPWCDAQDTAQRLSVVTAFAISYSSQGKTGGLCHSMSLGTPCSAPSSTSLSYGSWGVTNDAWGLRPSVPTSTNWGLSWSLITSWKWNFQYFIRMSPIC